jgi:hypothetical protein
MSNFFQGWVLFLILSGSTFAKDRGKLVSEIHIDEMTKNKSQRKTASSNDFPLVGISAVPNFVTCLLSESDTQKTYLAISQLKSPTITSINLVLLKMKQPDLKKRDLKMEDVRLVQLFRTDDHKEIEFQNSDNTISLHFSREGSVGTWNEKDQETKQLKCEPNSYSWSALFGK